jgi:hypothetical protein
VEQAHVPEVETALVNCKLCFQITQTSKQVYQPTAAGDKDKGASETPVGNLVELSIYGIASIYERPPPDSGDKKSEKKDGKK